MKIKQSFALKWMTAAAVLSFAILAARAQTSVLINAFDSSSELTASGWGNWFGTAYYQVVWDQSDASNNPSSGSMLLQAYYPDSGIGGCCGPQFVLYDGNNGINPPLVGNGGPPGAALATNVQFDVRFDPASFGVTNAGVSTNWPTIEVGTRGTNYGQNDFGTFTIPITQTNWVHEVIPIAANAIWTNIPNLYFKYYTTAFPAGDAAYLGMYIDNITFTTAAVPIVPPTMSMQKPIAGLRFFAGSTGLYDRSEITALDQNQSWVGGTYPVSYSVTFNSFPRPGATNENFVYHMFLLPVNAAGGNSFSNNQYIDYQAGNDLWLEIQANSTSNVVADVAWKTNLPNANPDQTVLMVTNPTALGTWTLTFNNATNGTLTPPGGVGSSFTLSNAATITTDFGNPLVAIFGIQPNSGWGVGQYADVGKISTSGVASPGGPINDDFTTDTSLNTNVWDTSNSTYANDVVFVPSTSAWWVYWTYPDYGVGLGTEPALNGAVPWKTPYYYNNSNTVFQALEANDRWSLVPNGGLPTVDGTINGAKSANGYFRLSLPGPTP